jgi:hypothetical protein
MITCLGNTLIRVSQRVYRNTRGKVEVFASIAVPYPAPFPALQHDGRACIDGKNIILTEGDRFSRPTARRWSWNGMRNCSVRDAGRVWQFRSRF